MTEEKRGVTMLANSEAPQVSQNKPLHKQHILLNKS